MGNPRHKRRRRTQRKRRACDTKATYYTEMAAMHVAVRFGQDWYRCPYCHRFHLTSKNSQPKEIHGED